MTPCDKCGGPTEAGKARCARCRLNGAEAGGTLDTTTGTLTKPEPTLYRVVDTFPYLDREDEWDDLTLDEAAIRVEDLFPIEAADVINDVEEGVEWPMVWTDEETGREITLSKSVS